MSENIIARGCLKYDLYVVNLDEAREKQASGPLTLEQTQGIVVKWMEAGQPCSQGEDGEWTEDENGCSIDGEHVLVTAGLPCGGPPAPEQIGNAWDEEDAEPAAEVKPETMVVYYQLAGGQYFGRRATKRQHHFFMEGCASFGIRPFSSIMGDSAAKIYPDMDWSTVAITDVCEDAFASLIEDVIDEARFADEEE